MWLCYLVLLVGGGVVVGSLAQLSSSRPETTSASDELQRWHCADGFGGRWKEDAVGVGDRMRFCLFFSFGGPYTANKVSIEAEVGSWSAVPIPATVASLKVIKDGQCGVYAWAATMLPFSNSTGPANCTEGAPPPVVPASCLQTYMELVHCDDKDGVIRVVPTATLVVKLVNGIVDRLSWDEGCLGCAAAATTCVQSPEWMIWEENGSDGNYTFSTSRQSRRSCARPYLPTRADPFRVFVVWEGTGKSGEMIFGSSFRRPSQWTLYGNAHALWRQMILVQNLDT